MSKLSVTENSILETCCKIEETCAGIYWHFSRLFEDNPEACELWIKTAQEEEQHSEQFRLAYHIRGTGITSLNMDLSKATAMLNKLQAVNDKVQNSKPSLKDALRFAIEMERSLSEFHMIKIAEFEDKSLVSLFTSMMKNDKEHILLLEKRYKALSEE